MINKIFSLFKKNFFRKNFFLIDDEIKLDNLIEKIKSLKVISVDTEFEWRRTYHPRLSLIQICDGNDVFLIDCLLCKNIEKVKFIFESVQILKVFHAVRSDTTVLFSSLGIKTNNVFDVQIAEKIINNLDVKSYSYLVEKYINLSINKSETNSNWMKRPFSNNQLKYASEDVEFLIDIYTKQNKLLDKKGKLKEAFYLSKEEAGLGNQELYISRLQKIKDKSEIDEKIFMWREELAKKKDIPTSFILSDKKLKKLSKRFFQEGLESDLSDLIDNNEHFEDFLNCLSK
ncbi:MAG: ribonuclease D [Pseudomonadota bacterium]|nr:ribonuclease D [Pseudomonadota bacterium]